MGLYTEIVQNYLAKATKATNSLTSADIWSFLGMIKYRFCPMWYKRKREENKKKFEQETQENLQTTCGFYSLEILQQDAGEYDTEIWHDMSYSGNHYIN